MNLIFIHGAGSSSKVWTYQKRYFSNYAVNILDLPGHGDKKGEGRTTISEYAEAVREEIKSLEEPVLVGHSMGGAITLMYAAQYEVKACVLVGTGAKLRVLPAVLKGITENYEKTIDFILQYAVYKKTEQIMSRSKKEMLATPQKVTYRDFAACNTFDMMQEISAIDVPALVVCGDQDMLTPVKYSEYLTEKMPHSKLEIIKECGHMVMLENPHRFNEIVENFLDNL